MTDTDLLGQLADYERRTKALEARNKILCEWIAGTTAELYCMQIGFNQRQDGKLGIDGFKLPSPSTRGAYETMKARMLAALTADVNGTDG